MLIEHLKKTYADRCRRNPQYSLRAFARSLNIDSSTLSAILRGKRPLTAKTAQHLIEALGIRNPQESNELLLGVIGSKPNQTPDYNELTMEAAEVISSWEHFAILAVLELDDFQANNSNIARRLNLPLGLAIEALGRLELLGLAENHDGKWKLTGKNLATPANISSTVLREPLRQCIEKSLQSLENDPLEMRDFSGMTMAISSKKLREAKRMILEFRRKLSAYLEDGTKDSVYRLNIQLFPISKEKP